MSSIISVETPTVRLSGAGTALESHSAASDTSVRTVEVGSTGLPALEPLVTVTDGGETAFYTQCSERERDRLVSAVTAESGIRVGEPAAIAEHDPAETGLPPVDLPGLDRGVRRILRGAGWRRPADPGDHEAIGGFVDPDPATVLDLGETLQGRGWGDLCQDAPPAETWRSVRDADGDPVVVVNAHGTPADALLLGSVPYEVLDGATAVAETVGADRVIVYASAADERAVETVREAVANYPGQSPSIDTVTGPAAYRAAEPTMALEAIEGNHRLEARIRPPGPESVGLHGQPTLLHTPRTLAHVSVSLRDGGEPGTRALTVAGDVATPATVELAESHTLGTAVDAVDVDGDLKGLCVGGRFGGLTRDLDTGLDRASLSAADLGTEGTVQVLAEDRCVLAFVGERAQFAADENCGRCVPCREGTTQLTGLLRDIYDGAYAPGDIEELVRVMDRSSICAFGAEAGRPARTALAEFESELQAHADGHCPTDSCPEPAEVQ